MAKTRASSGAVRHRSREQSALFPYSPYAKPRRRQVCGPRPRSNLEARFEQAWRLLRPAGMPLPIAEYRFDITGKRKWRFDFAFIYGSVLTDCQTNKPIISVHQQGGVAVELEGGLHSRGRHVRARGFQADARKYNAAILLGWSVLRFTAADLANVQQVVDIVAQALRCRRLA